MLSYFQPLPSATSTPARNMAMSHQSIPYLLVIGAAMPKKSRGEWLSENVVGIVSVAGDAVAFAASYANKDAILSFIERWPNAFLVMSLAFFLLGFFLCFATGLRDYGIRRSRFRENVRLHCSVLSREQKDIICELLDNGPLIYSRNEVDACVLSESGLVTCSASASTYNGLLVMGIAPNCADILREHRSDWL